MRILTRYLLKSHIGPFFFALFALTGILFVNAVARRFEELAGKGLPAGVVLEVFVLSLPHILALTLPMAVLVAVLYAFAQMSAENEITALKASGASLIRMIMPLVVAAFLFAGFMLWFNDRLLPDSNARLKNLLADIGSKRPTLELTEQIINPISAGDYRSRYYLQAARIDDETQRMWDVVIYDLSATNARKARTIYADSGSMALNPELTDLMLTLYDGVVYEVDEANAGEMQRVAFAEQRVELKGVGSTLERTQESQRSDREMSIAMLQAVVDTARRELEQLKQEAQQVHNVNLERVLAGPAAEAVTSGDELPPSTGLPVLDPRAREAMMRNSSGDEVTYRAALEAQRLANNAMTLQGQINQYSVEVHKKYAIPIACIIFVLIGAPLAVRFPRGGIGMVIAASLAIFAIYYMSLIGGESLGDRGSIPPFVGPWAPNLLFGVIAVWALSRIGRETASSRGGGWDDLWLSIRGLLRRAR